MDYVEILMRLGLATLAGGAIGLNRDLQNKPTGIRTLGIVGLGSALIVMASLNFDGPGADRNVTRVVQGVITGIGFLGAGVIFRHSDSNQVQGLTTAACIWLTAAIGMACGFAAWRLLLVGLPLAFLVLIFGGPVERAIHRARDRWEGRT